VKTASVGGESRGADVEALARAAEAEAKTALAAAEQARARAELLRQQAQLEAQTPDVPGEEATEAEPRAEADEPLPGRRRRLRMPTKAVMATGMASLFAAALLSVSGYMVWHHQQAQREQQIEAEYEAAARQVVFTLMSIDAEKAEENVAQILDSSTGQFHNEFEGAATDFIRLAQDGQVVTDVSVKAAAVESMTDDSAVVMVTAASTVSNSAGADTQPRQWRLRVDVVKDEGQLKMSKMEFVL
jgi:Mce-associated membrane protein